MDEAVFDILGNPINAGDRIVQYRGRSQDTRIGNVIYAVSVNGRARVKANGTFKRFFAPKGVINLTALGIPVSPRTRSEDYPDNMREFNRRHIRDAVGTEARANDKVLFWVSQTQLAVGSIRYFCGDAVNVSLAPELNGDSWKYYHVNAGAFVIFDGECPVEKNKLYRKPLPLPKPQPSRPQKRTKDRLAEMNAAVDRFAALYRDWKDGLLTTESFRISVDGLLTINPSAMIEMQKEC